MACAGMAVAVRRPWMHVVWASRHGMLPAEREALDNYAARHGYKTVTVEHVTFVETAESLAESLRPCLRAADKVVVIAVVPLSVVARLAEIASTAGFEVWQPGMETVAEGDPAKARVAAAEYPERRAIVCYRNGTCKAVEFRGFRRVKRVVIEGEPVWP